MNSQPIRDRRLGSLYIAQTYHPHTDGAPPTTTQEAIEQQEKKNDKRRIDNLLVEVIILEEQLEEKRDQVRNLEAAFERSHSHTQPELF